MGLESWLRTRAHRVGLEKMPLAVAAYRQFSTWRFRNRWEDEVEFKGARFAIGCDLSLYPAVRNGGFEAAELDMFLPTVRPDDTVWDVGANIGIYAVLLAAAAPEGRVEAFEPVPDSFRRLEQNVAANAMDNVTTHFVALSDTTGTARMAVHADAHGCDQIGEVDDDAEAIDVPTLTGDEFLASTGGADPDVVKVDIEGHEPQFLDGAWGMFERRAPLLMMEVNPTAWTDAAQVEEWQATVDRLFALYGSGLWFDTSTPTDVTELDVAALDDTRAFTLLFPGRARP